MVWSISTLAGGHVLAEPAARSALRVDRHAQATIGWCA
jgi:hypothetical protein